MTSEEINALREASKRDTAFLVGSDIRQLCTHIDALTEEVEALRAALTEIAELLSFEINPSNYDEDDVSRLNGNSIDAWQVARAALKGKDQ